MKASFVLSVLAFALTTRACDHYKYCACLNADGTTNDEITGKVCDFGYTRVNDQPFLECKHFSGNWFTGYSAFDNCKFRESCQYVGGTGDSRCRAKYGIFKA
ncbi:hypothetical protein CGCS363_v009356 [Colletotrichum siamense]|uniref:uncharacterized protein n=1 Tax=Colletotrichum siamense TaxID=690259 RepID=UPI00187306D0|nr:uncharacterized protein CGCS363_v009356 [Colletotrichum siamense]KAF5494298.1 hypothetical protein CGCS363_v009356 [Colletotrichum siamense]